MTETDLQNHAILKNLFAIDANEAVDSVLNHKSQQIVMANLLAMITLMIHLYPDDFNPEFMEEIMRNRFNYLKKKYDFLRNLDVNFLNDDEDQTAL